MSNRGGYQKPAHPAPVSGPGSLSKRTDGGPAQPIRKLPGGPYGSGKEFQAMEQAAPMAADNPAPSPAAPAAPASPLPVTPFGAPTQNPGEPVTAGAASGPGVGPEALGLAGDPQQQIDQEDAQRLLAYLPVLEWRANQPGSSAALRSYVRQIKVLAT